MSERRECFCGRRTVFEFGLTDDDGNAHTWCFCGKDDDGQGLDVNTLLSERMEAHERAWRAEAATQRVRELLEPYVPCPSHDDDCDSVICALRLALGLPLDGDGTEDNQADFWDGDVPLGGDDMDGR